MAAISNFWQRVITGSLFLLIMIGSIVASFQSFLFIFFVVTILATREYIKITSLFASPNKTWIYIANISTYLLVACILLYGHVIAHDPDPFKKMIGNFLSQRLFVLLGILFPVLIIASEIFRKTEKPFDNMAVSVFGFVYIAIPFILLVQAFSPVIGSYDYQAPLAYFLLLWSTDTFAYVWGKLLGKHKLVPHISQGKTVEGTLGAILTTIGFAACFPFIFPKIGYSMVDWVFYGAIIAIFAIPGDLSESLLKRRAGLKDSGNILPGHGGILDRFDSVFLTAPVIYIYTLIIRHL